MTDLFDLEDEPSVEPPESHLCKELLGKDYIEDPKDVLATMMEDRRTISDKYGIPLIESRKSSNEYCKELIGIAEGKGIPIVYKDTAVLEKADIGAGITSQGKLVLPSINLDTANPTEARNWSIKMGHELIHAIQSEIDPNMSIERSEYEAYVATYLPTAVGLAYKDCQKTENYLMYFTAVNRILSLVKGSSLSYYKIKGIPESSISWNRTV